MDRKFKVAFVLNTDIRLGGGVEKVVLNYIKNAPLDNFEITVMQTDYYDEKRISDNTVKNALKNVKVLSVKGYDHKFDFLTRNRIGLIFTNMVLIPLSLTFARFSQSYRKVITQLCENDIIYLFKNDYHILLPKCKSTIIGSNHTGLANERNIVNRIEINLIGKGFLDRNIGGFHLFPSKKNVSPLLNKRYNLLLANGVDTTDLVPSNKTNDGKVKLLFVGRLEPYKGIRTLLTAWDSLEDKENLELHIVGGGSLWEEVARRVKKGMVYHGIVSNEELSRIYREADVFVYPTEWDSQPLVVLEALSSGLYVITSETIRGTFDDFEEKKFLEYVENDPKKLAERISRISENWNYQEQSQKQHEYVNENYNWKIITERLFSFFKSIVQNRN